MNCWFHRIRRARRLDADLPLPASQERHLNACPACRVEWAAEQQAARAMASWATISRAEPGPFLHGKIMAGIRRETEPGVSLTEGRFDRPVAAVTLAIAAVFVAALIWPSPPSSSGSGSSPSAAFTIPWPNSAELARWGTLLDQPLREEGRLMLEDARNAVSGLASTLLPGDVPIAALLPHR